MTDQIRCPHCSQRMFDVHGAYVGHFTLKCPRCKQSFDINSNMEYLPVLEQIKRIASQPRTEEVPQTRRTK